MARKRYPPDDPLEWLGRARSNLAHSSEAIPEVYLEDLCFDAQQCAEKAIKAVFVSRGESFPYIHELKELLLRLQRNGVKIPKYIWEADKLTPFAAVMRYPWETDSVSPREYRRAVRIATAVLRWAERQVAVRRKSGDEA